MTLTKCFELHNQKDDLKVASITLTKRSSLHILEFWKYEFLNHNFALNVISFQYVNTFRIKSSACVFCSSEHIACEYMTKDIYIYICPECMISEVVAWVHDIDCQKCQLHMHTKLKKYLSTWWYQFIFLEPLNFHTRDNQDGCVLISA